VFAGEKSLKIIDKLRFDRYEQIYKTLCSADSPAASLDCSNLHKLDFKLAQLISPLIEQLAYSKQPCNLKEFCEALDKFARKLSPIDKSTLCSTSKAPQREDVPSFVPQITKYKSVNLKDRAKLSLYDRLVKDKAKARTKTTQKKLNRLEHEQYECTFHPTTLEYRKLVRSRSNYEYGVHSLSQFS
jgi:hypothetical protein